MILKDQTILKDIRAGITQVPELSRYILRTFPITEIVDELSRYIIADQTVKPISISKADFEAHFRIIGQRIDDDGNVTVETRGRKAVKR